MSHKLNVKNPNGSGHKQLDGYAQIIQGKLWVYYKGQTFVSEATTKSGGKKRAHEGRVALPQIVAPMPGKITKIFVEEKQELSAGQPVVVMEAMKMEYTLKCEHATCVDKILVAVGDQVPLGQVLVKFNEVEV